MKQFIVIGIKPVTYKADICIDAESVDEVINYFNLASRCFLDLGKLYSRAELIESAKHYNFILTLNEFVYDIDRLDTCVGQLSRSNDIDEEEAHTWSVILPDNDDPIYSDNNGKIQDE